VFHDGADVDGGAAFLEADTLNGVGVPGILVEGDKVFEKVDKELMVSQDEEEVIFYAFILSSPNINA
jgi:hypothetical protein